MLFPDWANAQDIKIEMNGWTGDNYTVTQDSFLIGLSNESNDVSPVAVLINGKDLFRGTYGSAPVYNNAPCFYCTKGTVLKNESRTDVAFFKVIPLVKSGGGHKFPIVSFLSYQLNNMVCINNEIKFKKRA